MLGIPLVGVAKGSTLGPVRPEATYSHSSEPARERIQPALLLGNVMRYERMGFPELASWAYSFFDSMSGTYYSNYLSSFCLCFLLIIIFVLQVGCLAAAIEAQAAVGSRKVVEAEAALESERTKLEAKKAEVFKASKAINGAMAIIS